MPDSIEGSKVWKDTDRSNVTSRVRVLRNTTKRIRVSLSKGPRLVRIGQQRKIAGRKPTPIWIDFTVKSKESNMSVSDSLFCFASNKIDFHPCSNCRAPMLVRIKSAGSDLSVRTFECFNCDNVVVMPDHHSEISL